MNDLAARVTRLQDAAWRLRRASGRACGLPFALALMTDERAHPDLGAMIGRFPPARGRPILVVFRHYGLEEGERQRLAREAFAACKRGGHLMVAADLNEVGAHGIHNARGPGLSTASVHSLAEGRAKAVRLRPDLGLVSPVFPTGSHPRAPAFGPARAASIASRMPYPCFALGGVDEGSAARLTGTPFQGIAVLRALRT
jgi:thiamine-phosphate pyrophosphorylase